MLIHLFHRYIPRGSAVLAITTLGSYALGLLRDRVFAQTFGATRALDAYNASFLVPDFVFNFLVASGIAAAFVPVLTRLLKRNPQEAEPYIHTVITAAIGTMALAAITLFIFAPLASRLVAPGFDEPAQQLVARLLRILSLSPILFAASNALGALLITKRRFLFYGLSPILYNLGIISGALWLAPTWGVTGVAIGTVAGAALHLGVRLIDVLRTEYRWRPRLDLSLPSFRRTLRLMVPKMFGHPIEMATFWAFTAIASLLAPGSIAVLNFARNFQSVPVSLIGITVATASFPLLAQAAADNDQAGFKHLLLKTSGLVVLAGILAAVTMYLIREPLIAILLGGGAFDRGDVLRTAMTLGVFTLAIPTEALMHVLARSFYALHNTFVPVAIGLLSFAIALAVAWLLAPLLGVLALPLAFFIGSGLRVVFLALLLPRQIRLSLQ